MMIKLLKAHCIDGFKVEMLFSDGTEGVFDAAALLQRKGSLLDALREEAFFKRAFIDAGALCWPNGLELSPARLREMLIVTEAA